MVLKDSGIPSLSHQTIYYCCAEHMACPFDMSGFLAICVKKATSGIACGIIEKSFCRHLARCSTMFKPSMMGLVAIKLLLDKGHAFLIAVPSVVIQRNLAPLGQMLRLPFG